MARKRTFGDYFKRLDLIKRNISFREKGNEFYGSIFGSFITLLIIIVISIYGI